MSAPRQTTTPPVRAKGPQRPRAGRLASIPKLALGAALLTALSAVVSPAVARPAFSDQITDMQGQAAQLAAQIAQQGDRMSVLAERYDEAQVATQSIDARVATDQAQLAQDQQQVSAEFDRLRHQAVAAFIEGGPSSTLSVLLGSTQENLPLRRQYLDSVLGSESDTINSLHSARQRLESEQSSLQGAQRQAHFALLAADSAAQAAANEQAQAQATLAQVKGQIATLVAQQQQAAIEAQTQQAQALLTAQLQALNPDPAAGTTTVVPPGIPQGTGSGAQAVAAAESYLGIPYVWGGQSRSGVDCSGLTMLAWQTAGVSLTHFAAAQYDESAHIPVSQLQPGDLLFFDFEGSGISHVTMYIGGGYIIEASQTGEPVWIRPIYLGSGFVGAGRP